MALHQLVFESALTHASEANLAQIFSASRRNNKRNNITGMVLCAGRKVISILEGEHEVVKQTFQRICGDQRHRIAQVVCEHPIQERSFSKWNTGYRLSQPPLNRQNSVFDGYFLDGFDLHAFRTQQRNMTQALSNFTDLA